MAAGLIALAAFYPASLTAQITVNVTNGPFTALTDNASLYEVFHASTTDLANQNQPTFSSISGIGGQSASTDTFGFPITNLINGTVFNGDRAVVGDWAFEPANGQTITITFNTSLNPLGYALSGINVLTGTGQQRQRQNFDVAWAAPGSSTYFALYSVTNQGSFASGDYEVLSEAFISGGGYIADGVGSLRFTFHDIDQPVGYNQAMYREIDVFGAASSVPEPSTYAAIFGATALLFAGYKRRRRVMAA